ncbi:TPA: hypothetical protein QCI16_003528 [Enterobacter ludwigii]|nr:hypothetical protein [Enterobacter ludwigii]HDR2599338.1 hypothetical protein [Enterobacter ludwigii]
MSTITKEFTKEQLQQIEAAAKEVMWPVVWSEKKAREHFSEKITPKVVLRLARIALASLEAEPVISHVGSKNALDAIVSFIKSNRNPTLKDHKEVSERLFQDNCQSLSSHVIEYINQIGDELEELRSTQDTAPPAPVFPRDLEEIIFTIVNAMADEKLRNDENELFSLAKKYIEHAKSKLSAAMLQGADGNSPVIPDGSEDTKRLDWLDAQNKRLNEYYGTSYGWKFDANFQRNAMMLNDSNYPVMSVRQAIDEAIAAAPQQEVKS